MMHPTREETLRFVEKFTSLADAMDRADLAAPLRDQVMRFAAGVFRLVVVGEIKKGKTSFINALLGIKDFLPTSSDVATSTVYKIYYGPEHKFKVFFLPDPAAPEAGKPPLEIPAQEVVDYGTEDGNPDNVKRVDFIAVEAPHPLLKAGLAIIDTPGLGGLFTRHADITWRYIPKADAIFFLLDSVEAVMTRDETAFLQRLRQFTKRIFFVQTKTDTVEEDEWRAWSERNQTIIAETLGVPKGSVPYFHVSSNLKFTADRRKSPQHLQRSGFLALLEFLNGRLLPAKESLLGRELLERVAIVAVGLKSDAENAVRVARADSREKLETMQREFQEGKERLAKWEQRRLPELMERFTDGLARIESWARDEFAARLDAAPAGPAVSGIIHRLRADGAVTAQSISVDAAVIQSACVDACVEAVFDIQERANRMIRELMGETLAEMSEDVGKLDLDQDGARGPILPAGQELHMHFSTFENLRTGIYGGMAGGMMGTLAVGILAAVFPPILAVAPLIPAVGTVLGSYFAGRDRDIHQKEQALGQLQQILGQIVQKAQQQGYKQFVDNLSDLRRKVRDICRENLAGARENLDRRTREIETAVKNTAGESQEALSRAEDNLGEVDALLRGIAQVCAEPSARAEKG